MSNFAVKLALFYFSTPFFPRGNTSSSNAIASDCIPPNQLYRQSASNGTPPNSVGDNQAGLHSYSGFQDAVLLLSSASALTGILLTDLSSSDRPHF